MEIILGLLAIFYYKVGFYLLLAGFSLFVLLRTFWFGFAIAARWRILFLAVLFLGLFGYESIFRQEQEHLLTLRGVPFLFPKWSVLNVAYDENGPQQVIISYGVLLDFNTWNKKLLRNHLTFDPNYIQVILDTTSGSRVIDNIRSYVIGGESKSGYSIRMLDDLGLKKYEHPDISRIVYFSTDDTVEVIVITCNRPRPDRPNDRRGCRAYFERGGYGVQFNFRRERLPDWKFIHTKAVDYVETLRRRGDQATGVLD